MSTKPPEQSENLPPTRNPLRLIYRFFFGKRKKSARSGSGTSTSSNATETQLTVSPGADDPQSTNTQSKETKPLSLQERMAQYQEATKTIQNVPKREQPAITPGLVISKQKAVTGLQPETTTQVEVAKTLAKTSETLLEDIGAFTVVFRVMQSNLSEWDADEAKAFGTKDKVALEALHKEMQSKMAFMEGPIRTKKDVYKKGHWHIPYWFPTSNWFMAPKIGSDEFSRIFDLSKDQTGSQKIKSLFGSTFTPAEKICYINRCCYHTMRIGHFFDDPTLKQRNIDKITTFIQEAMGGSKPKYTFVRYAFIKSLKEFLETVGPINIKGLVPGSIAIGGTLATRGADEATRAKLAKAATASNYLRDGLSAEKHKEFQTFLKETIIPMLTEYLQAAEKELYKTSPGVKHRG